ncbi:hypothetical protein OR1_02304 [Geobacter sp. OR-1]|uniref:BatD family protein n=1 Tax=Geobacter sp. OR-1 TaxID=1266765 RepID=UPI0005444540|nr:BatD family protein [Geobacter sp. OR-1]GAM10019.1 hypothetical protein OR1_02304 [Geobacter sp. OR-1]
MNRYCFYILLLALFIPLHSAAGTVGENLTLEIELAKKQAYPGEVVPLTVTFRANGVTVRNIGYPNLGLKGSGRIPFASPSQVSDDDGRVLAYRFSGRLIAGEESATIGPATLECEVMEPAAGSAAFFGEATPAKVTVTSPVAQLQLLPLPNEGRPASFSGAVGRFSVTVVGKPDTVNIGDPITVITTISGTGSLEGAQCPNLSAPGVQSFPSRSTRTGKGLNCEQIVIPRNQAAVPPVKWSYFDPAGKKYETITRAIPSVVNSATRVPDASTPPVPVPSSKPKASGSRNIAKPLTISLLLGGALFLAIFSGWRLRTLRRAACRSLPSVDLAQLINEAELSLQSGDVEKFYTLLFGILQHIVAKDAGIPAHSISGGNIVSAPSVEISALFLHCDQVRYGQITPNSAEMNSDLNLLKKVFSSLNLPVTH